MTPPPSQRELPETLSPLSWLVIKIELAAVAIVLACLGMHHYRAMREDHRPIRISALALPAPTAPLGPVALDTGGEGADAAKGQMLFLQTCVSCHGQNAQGMPHMGLNLRTSKFIAKTDDQRLVAFLKMGRKPTDPLNTTGLLMPPRGGNPALDGDSLQDIVAFLRGVQKDEQTAHRAAGDEKSKLPPAG